MKDTQIGKIVGTLLLTTLGVACGDDSGGDGSATAGSTSEGSTATAGTSVGTDSGATESQGGSETQGGSESTTAGTVGTTAGPGTDSNTDTNTSAATNTDSATGASATDSTDTGTTGPSCEDLCEDGVCIDELCCPLANACGDHCCNDGQLCEFQACVDPGSACITASECAAGEYCDYSLGEAGDKICGGGGTPDTGKCLPLPPSCEIDVEPNDLDTLDCLPQCLFDIDNAWTPQLRYEWKDASVMMPPIITQLDDDNCDGIVDHRDVPDIIFSSFAAGAYNNNGTMHAVSIIDGELVKKWSVNPQSDRIWPGKALAAADLDGVPGAEIVACTENGRVRAFRSDGSNYWVSGAAYCDMPSLADFDGDGKPEVLVSGNVLNGQTGAVKATFPVKNSGGSWWREKAIAADIDGDGVLEIVTATAAFEADGALILDTKLTGTYPAIADFDGDGKPEVAALANYGSNSNIRFLHVWRYDPDDPAKFKILRQNLDINGPLSPTLCPVGSNGRTAGGGPLTVAEFNGDGKPDVGVAGGIGYAVFDGAKLVDPDVSNADTLMWIKQTQDCSSAFTGSSVYDFDGDNRAEVVYGDELYLRIYRGFDGHVLYQTCNTSGTLHEYPLIADIDSDKNAAQTRARGSNSLDPGS